MRLIGGPHSRFLSGGERGRIGSVEEHRSGDSTGVDIEDTGLACDGMDAWEHSQNRIHVESPQVSVKTPNSPVEQHQLLSGSHSQPCASSPAEGGRR